jgi:hypothetical protein
MYLWNKQSPANLSFYRPNQAIGTNTYGSYRIPSLHGLGAPPVLSIAQMKVVHPLHGLGDDASTGLTVDPKLLLTGVGLLAAGMFLFGAKHGPRLRKRKAARLRRRLAALEG